MAGHSQFKNIMHRKGAQDAKRAKIFAKLAREITVAVKIGTEDPKQNPRLRSAIINARSENMPNDKISKAIKKAIGNEDDKNYQEVRYEGYALDGIALIIEALTDNRNRTASEVRAILSKNGGSLAESGSVSYGFDHLGEIKYTVSPSIDSSLIFDLAVEAGALDINTDENYHTITCLLTNFNNLKSIIAQKFGEPLTTKTQWIAKEKIIVKLEQAQILIKMMDALEDNEDIQSIHNNFIITEEILEKIS